MTVQEYNDLYKRPMVKNVKIESSGGVTITNTNIVSEQMSLEKSLCSESNLRFGRCEAACFKVRIADIDHDFTGEWLNVTQDAKADIEGYLLTQDGKYLYTEDGQRIQIEYKRDIEGLAQLGHFKVYSDKPDNDRRWKNLTCYDKMYDILNADVAAWYNGLTFPMTIKALRDSFFNYIGVTQKTTTLVNDNFVTQGGFSVTGSLSGKTVIEAICELNGVFGVMTPDDTFDYVSLANPETLTLDYYVDGTGSYEDYVTDVITGICAKGSESDIGTSVGTTENVYTIVNNPLINGTEGTAALTTALNNLLQNVLSISFRPFQVTTYGNPMLPLGTRITINTRNQAIISYVINKEMTGVQGLRDKISAKSDKHQSENINSSYDEIYRTKGKVHELKIDVDGLVSRMATTENKLDNDYYTKSQTESKISQTESEIMTTVSNSYVTQASYNAEIQNLQDQIDGRIEYFDGNVVPTLNNPPANSWTTTAAKDSHIGDLYRYHYTDGGVNKTDYYRFDKDTSTTPATYSWVVLGESQVDEALRQAELANQKADAAQQQLNALQSDVEDNYYTKSATDSKIQQTANSITQSVSSTYETKSDSTSKFNTANANAQGYANTALATANTNAQGYANDAKNAANSATDTKLQSYYTKTQTDSQIAQTANSITSSVSSTYETKSDATAKLNTANSNAQTYANNARDSANASTDNKLQSYYTKSETNSQIQQTATSITQSVSATYTTKEEFGDLQIGGKNILYLSDKNRGKPSVTTYNIGDFPFTEALIENEVYTITAKVTTSPEKTALAFYHSGGSIGLSNWMLVNDEQLYEYIFTANSTMADQTGSEFGHGFCRVYVSNNPSGRQQGSYPIEGTANVEWIKIEKGNKATDWSPAPEDLENYADEVGTAAVNTANAATDTKLGNYYTKTETNSQIQQTANSITSTVAQTYTTKTEFNNLEIGGRNLVKESAVRTTPSVATFSNHTLTNAVADNKTNLYMVLQVYNNNTFIGALFDQISITTTGRYTHSFVANRNIPTNYYLRFKHNGSTKDIYVDFKLSEEILTGDQLTISFDVVSNHPNTVGGLVIKDIQLERGNKATDWSQAPEDVEAYADSVGASTLSTANTNAQTYANNAKDAANAATDQKLTNYSTKSEVTQLANKIVMKVDANGNIVKVALSADPSTGTTFTVGADNIDLSAAETINLMAGGTINLSAQHINISGSSAAGAVSMSEDGILTCSGAEISGTIYSQNGEIGGWSIGSDKLSSVYTTGNNSYTVTLNKYDSTSGVNKNAFEVKTIVDGTTSYPFAVKYDGRLIARSATIEGSVTTGDLTATGGTLAGWSIGTNKIYGGTSSTGVAAMIASKTITEWAFCAGGTSHVTYDSCKFRVGANGNIYANSITFADGSGGTQKVFTSDCLIIHEKGISRRDGSGNLVFYTNGDGTIGGTKLYISGTKSRVVKTEEFGTKLLYCYETSSPMFGDIGEGKIAEDGKCYVWLDSTFSETVKTERYQVFLQKYGQGECYVTERTSRYFVVEGDPEMCFGWEVKARQRNFENERLETYSQPVETETMNYGEEALKHLEVIQDERTVA